MRCHRSTLEVSTCGSVHNPRTLRREGLKPRTAPTLQEEVSEPLEEPTGMALREEVEEVGKKNGQS